MSDLYDYILHQEYEVKINNEINIKNDIFKAIELHNKLFQDVTTYPNDQQTLYEQEFPFAYIRHTPEISISDYIISLNNYKSCGNLYTVRYLHPIQKFCEVIFLNPNENGKVYLIVLNFEFIIEKVIVYGNINLTTNTLEGVYY